PEPPLPPPMGALPCGMPAAPPGVLRAACGGPADGSGLPRHRSRPGDMSGHDSGLGSRASGDSFTMAAGRIKLRNSDTLSDNLLLRLPPFYTRYQQRALGSRCLFPETT